MATTNAMDVFARLAGVSAPEANSEMSAMHASTATAAGDKMAKEVPWIGGGPKGSAPPRGIAEEISMVGLEAIDQAADVGSKALGGKDSLHSMTDYSPQVAAADTSDSNFLMIPPNQWSGSESGNIAMDRLAQAAA